MKIALIGLGIIAQSHLKAIANNSDVELCAVCDVNEEKAKQISEQEGVPYFLDYREIPKKCNADAVIITLPHGLHCDCAVFFLESGMDVLLEKPMANTVAECDRIIAAAKHTGKKLAIAHPQMYFLANRRLKELVNSGELGKLCMVEEIRSIDYFDDARPRWFLNKKLSGGGITINYGAHFFDKLLYIAGGMPTRIVSNVGNVGDKSQQFDIEGHSQSFIQLDNGVSAVVTFCGYDYSVYENTYFFTEGTARVSGGTLLQIKRHGGKWEEVPDCMDGLAMERQLEDFVKFVRGETSEIVTAEEGRMIIASVQKIFGDL